MKLRALVILVLLILPCPPLAAAPTPPRLMLASVYGDEVAVADYWISEKLDGVRGHWTGERLLTRGGHPVNAPAWFTTGWPDTPLDGELWIDRERFEEVSAIVRTQEPDAQAWRQVKFMLFDLPAHPGPFEARVLHMRALVAAIDSPWLQAIPQFRLSDHAALTHKLEEITAAGGEGLMLHHRDAHYRAGRSSELLKYKLYDDAEARVVGYTEGRGKYRGLLGALIVERPDGLRFRLGTGFTDAQRADPPPLGSWVTYRYNGLTGHGTPRFARFLRIRHELPPPDPE